MFIDYNDMFIDYNDMFIDYNDMFIDLERTCTFYIFVHTLISFKNLKIVSPTTFVNESRCVHTYI
jgi:hypothetical protein